MHPTQNHARTALAPSSSDTLRGAACYLMNYGWTQDEFYADAALTPQQRLTGCPPADVLGAIMIAVSGHRYDSPQILLADRGEHAYTDYTRAVADLARWLHFEMPELWPGTLSDDDLPHLVWSWNDDPEQTAPAVIDTLARCAANLNHEPAPSNLAELALSYAILHNQVEDAR